MAMANLSEPYVNGKPHGTCEIWYPNGILRARRNYTNGTIDSRSGWCFPSG